MVYGLRLSPFALPAGLLVACFLLLPTTSPAAQAEQTPPPSVVETPKAIAPGPRTTGRPPSSPTAGQTRLGSGDKLSVKIYERPDLSGEFTVRSDGTISLPLIGAFSVEDRLPGEVERDIGATLDKITGRATTLVVEVVEWRPIYVVGAVDKPGTYPYKPHMTVLQVLAASGGPYRLSSITGNRIEAGREELSHWQNVEKLKSLLVRRARLDAELNGKDDIEVPARLNDIATPDDIESVISAEKRVMSQRTASYQQSLEGASRKVEMSGKEIELLKEQLAHTNDEVRLTKAESADLQNMAQRGLTPRTRLLDSQRLVSSLEANVREIAASLTRAELGLTTAEKEKSILEIEHKLKLEEEMRTNEEDLRIAETALKVSSHVTGLGIRGGIISEPRLRYQVIRREGDRQVASSVDESSELLPGDVIRITFDNRP